MRSKVSFHILSRGSTLKDPWAPLLIRLLLMLSYIYLCIYWSGLFYHFICLVSRINLYIWCWCFIFFFCLLCVFQFIFYILCHFYEKKGDHWQYLIHLNRRSILKWGEHITFESFWEKIFEIFLDKKKGLDKKGGIYSFGCLIHFFL